MSAIPPASSPTPSSDSNPPHPTPSPPPPLTVWFSDTTIMAVWAGRDPITAPTTAEAEAAVATTTAGRPTSTGFTAAALAEGEDSILIRRSAGKTAAMYYVQSFSIFFCIKTLVNFK